MKPDEDLLATANYNLGVVNEHLKNYNEAKNFYHKSKYGQKAETQVHARSESLEKESLRRLALRQKKSVAEVQGYSAI